MAKSLLTLATNYMNMVAAQRQNAAKIAAGEWDEDDVFAEAFRQACIRKGRVQEADYTAASYEQRPMGALFADAGEPLLTNPVADEEALTSGEGRPARLYPLGGHYAAGELRNVTIGMGYERIEPVSRSPEMAAIIELRNAGRAEEADRAMDALLGSTAWREVRG